MDINGYECAQPWKIHSDDLGYRKYILETETIVDQESSLKCHINDAESLTSVSSV